MRELEFHTWMNDNGITKKVQSDIISRIKRVERALKNCDIDEEYRSDKCEYLLSLFLNMGQNDTMQKLGEVDLPVGKYYMSTFRHAIKKYINFYEETFISKH